MSYSRAYLVALLLIIFLPCLHTISAQEHAASIQMIQRFQALQQDMPRERIFLHTDRTWYYLGDQVWFSAYVTAGPLQVRSGLSKVLYVELVEPDGTIADRVITELTNGRGQGYLDTANMSASSGDFEVRAYTAWSTNFGEAYTFRTRLTLLSDEGTVATTNQQQSTPPDVQFLPEGGHLIAGVNTRIGIKSVGPNGLGYNISGHIEDNSGNQVARFETTHLGMGYVSFAPASGESYTAIVGDDQYSLPEVQQRGASIQVSHEEDQFEVTVNTRDIPTNDGLILFAHVRGEVYFANSVMINNGIGRAYVNKSQIPTGVVHFTLLGADGKPVSERLAFNFNPVDQVEVRIQPDADEYGKRSLAELQLLTRNASGAPVAATGSISVYDAQIFEGASHPSTILSQLYLETELTGHIEEPGFYFSGEENAEAKMDLLLLTQGWRAYDMADAASATDIAIEYLPEQGLTVSGRVLTGLRGRPIYEAAVFIATGRDQEDANLISTDEDGRFALTDMPLTGMAPVSVRARRPGGWSRTRDNVMIEFDDPFDRWAASYAPVPQRLRALTAEDVATEDGAALSRDLIGRAVSSQLRSQQFIEAQMFGELDEVRVTADRDRVDQMEQEIRGDARRRSQSINMDESDHFRSMPVFALLNQIPGVSAGPGQGISISTGFDNLSINPPPLFLIDNMDATAEDVLGLSPGDIHTINVYRRAHELGYFGARGAGGVIVVQTRAGAGLPTAAGTATGIVNLNVQGYQPIVNFYTPQYGVPLDEHNQPDTRVTLYWKPDLELSSTGSVTRFWTNDFPSEYRIVVQGITETGLPFYSTDMIRVTD